MTDARASDINPQQAVNIIGGRTDIEKMTFSRKAGEMGFGDFIVIDGRLCKVCKIGLSSSGMLSFVCVDIFTGEKIEDSYFPDLDCEVPRMSRADYQCTGISEDDDSVTLVSDRGDTRDDLKLPTDRFLRDMMKIGLKIGKEVFVTVVSSMGEEHIHVVTYGRPDKQRLGHGCVRSFGLKIK